MFENLGAVDVFKMFTYVDDNHVIVRLVKELTDKMVDDLKDLFAFYSNDLKFIQWRILGDNL